MAKNNSFHTLIESISFRCSQVPQGRAFVFLDENNQEKEITNKQFYSDMQRYGRGLITKGIRPGEIILLALDHGYELLCFFWGAICCGAIPSILTYWRSGSDVDAYARKVKNLAKAMSARAVITLPDLYPAISSALEKMNFFALTAQEIAAGSADNNVTLPELHAEQIALMQFTSGTTNEPKAIQFSHRTILDHLKARAEAYQITPDCVSIFWLPFYHDMGLQSHICSLIHGGLFVSMAPEMWLRQPEMLLKAVDRYHGTITNMPNFGFDYCSQRISDDEIQGIDLSSWRILTNGSEPVILSSMQRFQERFEPYGFRREALTVAYGMAENVVGISVTSPGQPLCVDWVSVDALQIENRAIPVEKSSMGAKAVVSCGLPYPGIDLAIVDDRWSELAEREVGEIIIRSDTLFSGYYRHSEYTEGLFQEGWFRTGDLGYLVDGQLYVCGRKKDLIIVGGRNIQPQAIEDIAASLFGPLAARCAAFGINDPHIGTELPVLVIEERQQLEAMEKEALIRQVRKQVLGEFDIAISDVKTVPKGWVLKTTSGKIARAANRDKYLNEIKSNENKKHSILPDELTQQEIIYILINLFEKILDVTGCGEKDNFFILGGDSLSALKLLLEIERIFGREVSAADFLQQPTIINLAESLYKKSKNKTTVGVDASSWWRGMPISGRTKAARFSMLSRAVFRKIKSRTMQRIKDIIPGWLYKQRLVKYLLTIKRSRLIRQFYRVIEKPLQSEKEAIQYGLILEVSTSMTEQENKQIFLNCLPAWSLQVDMRTLERAYHSGKGVIMICWHSYFWINSLVKEFVLKRLQPNAYGYIARAHDLFPKGINKLEKNRLILKLYLEQLITARRILSDGKVISILSDANDGLSHGFSVPFHGRIRSFKAGFAELAVETGAAVIPVSLVMDVHAKRLIISSLNPLESGTSEMIRAERVEGLVKQYASFLKQEWARSPALIPSGWMQKHLYLPKT